MGIYVGGTKTSNKPFTYRAEYDGDDNIVYEAWSLPGTAEAAASWQICQHTFVKNNLTAIKWADGSGEFSFKWTKRKNGTYTYS